MHLQNLLFLLLWSLKFVDFFAICPMIVSLTFYVKIRWKHNPFRKKPTKKCISVKILALLMSPGAYLIFPINIMYNLITRRLENKHSSQKIVMFCAIWLTKQFKIDPPSEWRWLGSSVFSDNKIWIGDCQWYSAAVYCRETFFTEVKESLWQHHA